MTDTSSNKAMLLRRVNDMELIPYAASNTAPPGTCLIRIKSVGICGSDVHYFKHGKIGDFILRAPMVIGHEASGVVEAIGSGVTNVAVGDTVAMEPNVTCGLCEQCKAGKYNLCPSVQFFATPPIHGALQNFVLHPGKLCFKLPPGMDTEQGAMCEPLSCAVYACGKEKANVKPGQAVAVHGAGPIGSMVSMVAAGLGARTVILCDISKERLKMASSRLSKAGTHFQFVNTSALSPEKTAEEIRKLAGGRDVDSTIDACGAESAITAAILSTKPGGTVCLIGMGAPKVNIPLLSASIREVDLVGVFRYRNTYPTCIELISSGKVDVKSLITHRYTFENGSILEAFEACEKGVGKDGKPSGKCMINITDSFKSKL